MIRSSEQDIDWGTGSDGVTRLKAMVDMRKAEIDSQKGLPVPPFVCLVCGFMWGSENEPGKCPACNSTTWNNKNMFRHVCKQCSFRWMSKNKEPESCPECSSKFWNTTTEKYVCLTCKNIWNHLADHPLPDKCPRCESRDIVSEVVEAMCKRCGYSGKMNINHISICPVCRTTLSIRDKAGGREAVAPSHNKKKALENPAKDPAVREILLHSHNKEERIKKLIELTNVNPIDAGILVMYSDGFDHFTIATTLDVSLNKAVMVTRPISERRSKAGEKNETD